MAKRTKQVIIRLSDDEHALLKRNITKTKLSQEAYLRSLVCGHAPREKPDDHFYEVMRELSAISNKLNQIAQKATSLGIIDTPYFKREAEQWAAFRMTVKRAFLEPEKLVIPNGGN